MKINELKQSLKKSATILLTAAIVAANATPVLATDVGNGVGTINKDPKDIIKVNVPTSPNFDFEIDPSRMLHGSDSVNIADKTLLFKHSDNKYSEKTDVISISSNSTIELNVYMTGKLTNTGTAAGEVEQVDTIIEAETASSPSIAILISECNISGNTLAGATPVALTADGGTVSSNLPSWVDNYDKVTDGDKTGNATDGWVQKWKYQEKTTVGDTEYKYFVLEGFATPTEKASWDSITKIPKLKVTYVIKKLDGSAAGSYVSRSSVSATNNVVTLTPENNATVSKIVFTKPDGDKFDGTSSHYQISGSTLTFTAGTLSTKAGGSIAITFSDGHVDELAITS